MSTNKIKQNKMNYNLQLDLIDSILVDRLSQEELVGLKNQTLNIAEKMDKTFNTYPVLSLRVNAIYSAETTTYPRGPIKYPKRRIKKVVLLLKETLNQI